MSTKQLIKKKVGKLRELDDVVLGKAIIRPRNGSEYYYPITGHIEDFEQFHDLFTVLSLCTKDDVVRLYINSFGGDVATSEAIITAINDAKEDEVKVVGEIGMECASAASAIALSCSELKVFDYSTMLIHHWEAGEYGNAVANKKSADFSLKQAEKFLRRHYTHFLTKAELEDLISSPKDLLFDSDDITKRWANKISKKKTS